MISYHVRSILSICSGRFCKKSCNFSLQLPFSCDTISQKGGMIHCQKKALRPACVRSGRRATIHCRRWPTCLAPQNRSSVAMKTASGRPKISVAADYAHRLQVDLLYLLGESDTLQPPQTGQRTRRSCSCSANCRRRSKKKFWITFATSCHGPEHRQQLLLLRRIHDLQPAPLNHFVPSRIPL